MSIVTITAAAEEPISLAEARAQCRCGSDEDALLTIYVKAARRLCETITGRRLITQTVEERLDAFPEGDLEIRLSATPVQSITSVKYDLNEVEQTMDGSSYTLDAAAYPGGWLLPAAGTEWPATDDTTNCVRVRYVVGFGAASAVPEDLKAWMLLTIAALFEQRAAVDASGQAAALPDRIVDSLLDEWKVWG